MKSSKKPDFILYGGPASGKSTQAKLLVSKLKAAHLNMGGLLREVIAKRSPGYREIKKIVESGKLVPEKINSALAMKFISQVPQNKRIIFDGYPRRMSQAKILESAEKKYNRTNFFIFVDLPVGIARDRIYRRAKLENRVDDTDKKVISQRIQTFKDKSKELLKHYKNKGTLIRINGNQDITAVHKDILKAIKNL